MYFFFFRSTRNKVRFPQASHRKPQGLTQTQAQRGAVPANARSRPSEKRPPQRTDQQRETQRLPRANQPGATPQPLGKPAQSGVGTCTVTVQKKARRPKRLLVDLMFFFVIFSVFKGVLVLYSVFKGVLAFRPSFVQYSACSDLALCGFSQRLESGPWLVSTW